MDPRSICEIQIQRSPMAVNIRGILPPATYLDRFLLLSTVILTFNKTMDTDWCLTCNKRVVSTFFFSPSTFPHNFTRRVAISTAHLSANMVLVPQITAVTLSSPSPRYNTTIV